MIMAHLKKILEPALYVGGGAVFPYSESLEKYLARISRFGDPFNLGTVRDLANGYKQIMVPRNMAIEAHRDLRAEGLSAHFTSTFKPRNSEQQRIVLEAAGRLITGQSFMLEAGTGFGKCTAPGTLVIKGDGRPIAVEHIQNGDILMGPDSKPRVVSGTTKLVAPIYRVTPNKGKPFECNDAHVLSLKKTGSPKSGGGGLVNISVVDYLEKSDKFKHLYKLWRAPGIDLPHRQVTDPYLIGLYLADGTKEASSLTLGFLKEPCLDHVMAGSFFSSVRVCENAWVVCFDGFNDLRRMLVQDGERFIPERYLYNSRSNRMQLLAGLLDGDGHLVKKTVFELMCKDTGFKDQVLYLCRSLGLAAYASQCVKSIKSLNFSGSYWRICISGNTDKIPTKIPCKQASPRRQKKNHLVTGFKVEYVRDDWVYGFSLDQDHLYLLNDFTVTHNTVCALDVIARVGKKTLVVVTKADIRTQWETACKNILGISHGKGLGYIQGDTCEVVGNPLVIATIQSLCKKDRYPPNLLAQFGLVVFDEVHRVASDQFSQSCFRVPSLRRLGLSATADRRDGREEVLHAHIGPVKVRTDSTPLVPRVVAVVSPWHIPQVRKFSEKEEKWVIAPIPHSPGRCGHVTKILANHAGRNDLICRFTASAYKKGRVILVQSDLRNHLDVLRGLLTIKGVSQTDIGFYLGGMTAAQREESKGKAVILATYTMTAEATDIPWLDTLVMATPKSDIRQIAGRILRVHEGKKDPVIFDIVDLSSPVYTGYWSKRRAFYNKIGAEVKFKGED